jgi:hypothetical protein
MPILNIEGKRVTVDDSFLSLSPEEQNATVDEIAQSMRLGKGETRQAEGNPTLEGYQDATGQIVKEPAPTADSRDGKGIFEKIDAGMRGAADMMSFGFADEISAGLGTGFGFLGDYDKELARQRGIDQFDQENNAGARLTGQIAGGVTGGIGAAKNGATLLTREALKRGGKQAVARAAGEGAIYGGGYGFGSGEGIEDRVRQAGAGAVTGAVTGAAVQKIGNSIATRKAGQSAAAAAPATEQLKSATNALYQQAREAGVTISPKASTRLLENMKLAAGGINDKLRPNTAGIVQDLDDMLGKPMTLESLDELRQVVGQSMKRAQPQDQRTLMRMKDMLDNFADGLKASDVTGDLKGVEILKQARALNAQKAKTEIVEGIIDMAQVKGDGQYTQSGFANAIRSEMKSLYKKIKTGKEKGFSKEEVELIRKMASGGTSGAIMRLFSKFAPRGVVSFGVGQGVGSMIPGGNILIPGAGHFAAQNVDNAMVRAGEALRTSAATGQMPAGALGQVASSTAPKLVAPAAMNAEAIRSRLMQPR